MNTLYKNNRNVTFISSQKPLHRTTNILQIKQECIVPEVRYILSKFNVLDVLVANSLECRSDFALLPSREEDITGSAHD